MNAAKRVSMERIGIAALALLTAAPALGAKPKKKRSNPLAIPEVARDEVICFALYTVHDGILKLTAQLYPLQGGESRALTLEAKRGGRWTEVARAEVVNPGWTVPFRVEGWDMTKEVPYRVVHPGGAKYEGIVRANPVDKDEIVVAAFTGNSIYPGHGGDIPKTDIMKNLAHIKPDLLFFSGDQVYDHNRHYAYWLRFGRDFGEAIRNTPTVTIPDDHDVGMANIWGAGGKKSHTGAGHDGGYFKPVPYVQEVERAQTSHLPDPYDPTPILRGIGVYYTALTWGGVSFAIIEDRKFKTGPSGLIPKMGPRPDHIRDPKYDPKAVDVEGAVLLGDRQLRFLREWAGDWRGAEMKAVLSQTIFCGGAHLHGNRNNRLIADLDSNGWPQTGRNKAIAEIRRAFAVHIAGDQHLATIIHHGIDAWNDSCYSFCVPSIANLYLRWWDPPKPGRNRAPRAPEYTGENLDGFANRITVHAAANPGSRPNHSKLTTRSAGFGVVTFNKRDRTIMMECWPRNVDVSDRGAKQYAGWPKTVKQEENYGRKAVAWLPMVEVSGATDPVVRVDDEATGEMVYCLRINGTSWRPKVFKPGRYTVTVGEGAKARKFRRIRAVPKDYRERLRVRF
ncbi:MAG: alkaline phosphatase D family protein [Planctomycetota bacterium]